MKRSLLYKGLDWN